jgi:hypothetical protein
MQGIHFFLWRCRDEHAFIDSFVRSFSLSSSGGGHRLCVVLLLIRSSSSRRRRLVVVVSSSSRRRPSISSQHLVPASRPSISSQHLVPASRPSISSQHLHWWSTSSRNGRGRPREQTRLHSSASGCFFEIPHSDVSSFFSSSTVRLSSLNGSLLETRCNDDSRQRVVGGGTRTGPATIRWTMRRCAVPGLNTRRRAMRPSRGTTSPRTCTTILPSTARKERSMTTRRGPFPSVSSTRLSRPRRRPRGPCGEPPPGSGQGRRRRPGRRRTEGSGRDLRRETETKLQGGRGRRRHEENAPRLGPRRPPGEK